jgi:Ser/Thr protein kinase RdoA (MazF antagonist)
MHRFGEEWLIPKDFKAITYDAVIHYGEPMILFEPGRVELLDLEELLESAWRLTDERIEEINRRTPPFIAHADLHQWNVKIKRGVLSPFDFEDLLYSAPILDVATSLHYVRFRKDYPNLGAAFRAGYERHRPWVESEPGELDRLFISRALDLMNIVALESEVEVGNWSGFVSRRGELARVALGELPPVEI